VCQAGVVEEVDVGGEVEVGEGTGVGLGAVGIGPVCGEDVEVVEIDLAALVEVAGQGLGDEGQGEGGREQEY